MKVFISWSGERSKRVGEIFSKYLKRIIQNCNPFFSPNIVKGTQWISIINNELKESKVGIICITSDNMSEPWLLFESGAISKGVGENRVCTFLLDLESTDLTGPLAQFQDTKNSKDDIYKLKLHESLELKLGFTTYFIQESPGVGYINIIEWIVIQVCNHLFHSIMNL